MSKQMRWDRTRKGSSPSAFTPMLERSIAKEIDAAKLARMRRFKTMANWRREVHAYTQWRRKDRKVTVTLPKITMPE
jgi:hypothetical protein